MKSKLTNAEFVCVVEKVAYSYSLCLTCDEPLQPAQVGVHQQARHILVHVHDNASIEEADRGFLRRCGIASF